MCGHPEWLPCEKDAEGTALRGLGEMDGIWDRNSMQLMKIINTQFEDKLKELGDLSMISMLINVDIFLFL